MMVSFLFYLAWQNSPINIQTDKLQTIWWHENKLQTDAPSYYLPEALFEMLVLSLTEEGKCVQFKSMDHKYLIVDNNDQFQLSVSLYNCMCVF